MLKPSLTPAFLLFLVIPALFAQNDISKAILEGDVFNDADKTPLAGARVKLEQYQSEPIYARTDANGHFAFQNVTPGMYQVAAESPGFLRQSASSIDVSARGSLRATVRQTVFSRGMGTLPDAVVKRSISDDGILKVHVSIPLVAYAIIHGRITDPEGRPIDGASIEINRKMPLQPNRMGTGARILPDGQGELSLVYGPLQTNDKGEFRSPKLEPGSYYVAVNRPSGSQQWDSSFRATYYPAALDLASAKMLDLRAGQQVRADIQVLGRRGVRIAGRLIKPVTADSSIRSGTQLALIPEQSYLQNISFPISIATDEYEIKDVLPGKYVLMAYTRELSEPFGQNQKGIFGVRRNIEVADLDLDKLDLEVQPLRDLTGTVTFKEGCRPTPIRLYATLNPRYSFGPNDVSSDLDGNFVLPGLIPGRITVSVNAPFVESVVFGKRDVLRKEFDLPSAGEDTLQITVSCEAARGIR